MKFVMSDERLKEIVEARIDYTRADVELLALAMEVAAWREHKCEQHVCGECDYDGIETFSCCVHCGERL